MSKMPKFDWTRTAMTSSLLLSPEGFKVNPTNSRRAVSLACPKEAKSPYSMYGGLLTALLELVGLTMNLSGEST